MISRIAGFTISFILLMPPLAYNGVFITSALLAAFMVRKLPETKGKPVPQTLNEALVFYQENM